MWAVQLLYHCDRICLKAVLKNIVLSFFWGALKYPVGIAISFGKMTNKFGTEISWLPEDCLC